jgi:hypothetical protein
LNDQAVFSNLVEYVWLSHNMQFEQRTNAQTGIAVEELMAAGCIPVLPPVQQHCFPAKGSGMSLGAQA